MTIITIQVHHHGGHRPEGHPEMPSGAQGESIYIYIYKRRR